MKKITNLSVIAKEWWDRVNGNSYFSAQIQVNGETIYLPFQYGYDRMYLQQSTAALKNAGYEVGDIGLERYCRENNIPAVFHKSDKQLQRDVKAWGQ